MSPRAGFSLLSIQSTFYCQCTYYRHGEEYDNVALLLVHMKGNVNMSFNQDRSAVA